MSDNRLKLEDGSADATLIAAHERAKARGARQFSRKQLLLAFVAFNIVAWSAILLLILF